MSATKSRSVALSSPCWSQLDTFALAGSRPQSNVERTAAAVRRLLAAASPEAAYEVLRLLIDAGLIRRMDSAKSPASTED